MSEYTSDFHPWRGVRPWRRHSLVLLIAGFAYIGIGLSYRRAELPEARNIALGVALNWWNIHWWGLVFILAGVLAIVSSRWPPISRTWGYTVLTSLSAGWGTFYLTAIVFLDSPLGNISSAIVWYLIGFVWWAVSGLLNPGEG